MIQDVRTICFVYTIWPIKDFLVSEITVIKCFMDPAVVVGMCEPQSTSEDDSTKGRWVRIPRNLNMEASIFSGWLVCCFTVHGRYLIEKFSGYLLSSDQTTRY
jgi:hypothetical protein